MEEMASTTALAESGGLATAFWFCALLSLALLVVSSPVAEILLSRRRDLTMRLMRSLIVILFPAIVLVPGVMLADRGGFGLGLGMICHVVLFAAFCYYLGRRVGRAQGRQALSDLVGLESPERIEDVQDRLFESRMRYPNRSDVVNSIGVLAKEREAERARAERAALGKPPLSEVDVVEVDGMFEHRPGRHDTDTMRP